MARMFAKKLPRDTFRPANFTRSEPLIDESNHETAAKAHSAKAMPGVAGPAGAAGWRHQRRRPSSTWLPHRMNGCSFLSPSQLAVTTPSAQLFRHPIALIKFHRGSALVVRVVTFEIRAAKFADEAQTVFASQFASCYKLAPRTWKKAKEPHLHWVTGGPAGLRACECVGNPGEARPERIGRQGLSAFSFAVRGVAMGFRLGQEPLILRDQRDLEGLASILKVLFLLLADAGGPAIELILLLPRQPGWRLASVAIIDPPYF
jgi:hypothetical protein